MISHVPFCAKAVMITSMITSMLMGQCGTLPAFPGGIRMVALEALAETPDAQLPVGGVVDTWKFASDPRFRTGHGRKLRRHNKRHWHRRPYYCPDQCRLECEF
jgi:hypothetical protein